MRLAATFIIAALLLAPCFAHADVPEFMSYQGVLRDSDGNPVSDGFHDVDFYLYDVATGGTALWSEPHGLYATGGIIEAKLGSIVPFEPLPFDVPYWIGIRVEGEPELVPRTALATAPYAGYAATARECIEGDEDWTVDGINVYHEFGNVGIGTTTPDHRLEIVEADAVCARFENTGPDLFDQTVRVRNNSGPGIAVYTGSVPVTSVAYPSGILSSVDVGHYGGTFLSEDGSAVYAWSRGGGYAIEARTDSGLCAQFSGGLVSAADGLRVHDGLTVYGGLQVSDGLQVLPPGNVGDVLTADGIGVGTWQAPAAVPDGDWTINGNDIYSTVSGEVGIGTSSPSGKLDINNDTTAAALYVTHDGASVSRTIDVERTTTHNAGNDLVELSIPAGSSSTSQFIECDRGGTNVFAVNGNGYVDAAAGAEFGGLVSADAYADVVGLFTSSAPSNFAKVLSGISTATGEVGSIGVYGESVTADGAGVGCAGLGGNTGVRGQVVPTGSVYYYGVHGSVVGGSGYNYAIRGYAEGGSTSYGVYGRATGGSTNYAGYFWGNTHVSGTFTASSKLFKIDHPLDPENKYLQHSCVESDDMMNIYNGNVMLDARGEAWVDMPDWFEALNQDFRYQLTPMGAPGPNLYIAEEIAGGRFMIAGGEPGAKVSWQVTGVRHDAVALANRMSVEVDKLAHEAGKYLNPEAYGKPVTMAMDYHEERIDVSVPGEVLSRIQRPEQNSDDGE